MKRLFALSLVLLGLSFPVQAGQMSLLGAGNAGGGGGGAYSGPGDIQTGAKGFWGLRAYNATYATANGNIADIVDTATGASSCTIKAKTNGDADLSSLLCAGGTVSVTTFCTVTHAAGCSVKRLYDQSGALYCIGSTACDVSQATLASMPVLTLSCIGSLPCMSGNGSQQLSNTTGVPVISAGSGAPFSSAFVANRTPTASSSQGVLAVSNALWRFDATNTLTLYDGSPLLTATATDAAFHSFQGIINGEAASPTGEWYIDGSPTTGSVGNAGINASAAINIFADQFSNLLTGKISEVGFWTVSLHSVEASMCNNQRLYWGTAGSC